MTALWFVAAFFLFALLFLRFPLLYDGDSYYHLAVGRLYAAEGVVDTFRWARFSVMYDGFGDKEFLFHLFLAPFTVWLDPAIGGRLALALANAVFVALFVRLSLGAIGSWGAVVPILV